MAKTLASFAMAAALGLSSALATAPAAYALDDAQKKEIGDFIREYLLQNPEILFEVQDAMQAKQQAERLAKANAVISDNKDAIFNDKNDLVLGNPNGNVTVVEFYDYNCGYCKRAITDMQALIKSDDQIRFVLKEFPILGPDSVAAHRVAMAVRALAPEKYGDFHMALLGGQAHADEATAISVAKNLGVSEDDIRTQMKEGNGDDEIRQSYALADSLGINGTPAYVVGNELISGAVGLDTLTNKVANMRECGKASC
ncbi:DsbA family protein [Rhizobium sp. L1K21]|uniref:DsbA family protein n=1 Tax=Rhizobium sp. L1K21 TaxID=2954933 RepID=UPI002093CBDA|nr:DsbA family protein [Rhizobium sp. L1K21]MCO6186430.1 DsbA family protein [Rhizobium sp. L1K21]